MSNENFVSWGYDLFVFHIKLAKWKYMTYFKLIFIYFINNNDINILY